MNNLYTNKIFGIKSENEFQLMALELFDYQYKHNAVYNHFVDCLGVVPGDVDTIHKIPFLPIDMFRTQRVITGDRPIEKIFGSSGTTQTDMKSRHYVTDLLLYDTSLKLTFNYFYGKPDDYLFVALLPSYVEREDSSLVYMVKSLVEMSRNKNSRIDRTDIPGILKDIETAKGKGEKIFFIGVSFALLDCAERYGPDLSDVIVMETGGMKGRRKEIIREELHNVLKERFNVDTIHSEYGMTEMLSQAYSSGEGIYRTPPWMKILLRDTLDPLTLTDDHYRTGGINVIDLANINSCAFLATSDLGRIRVDGSFEVLGRFDNSNIRGCNLMASDFTL